VGIYEQSCCANCAQGALREHTVRIPKRWHAARPPQRLGIAEGSGTGRNAPAFVLPSPAINASWSGVRVESVSFTN